jgi:hypothetical protein
VKALVVWGGWEGHEPKACVDRFVPFLRQEGFAVEVSDTLDVFLDATKMHTRSLVVPCWTGGVMTAEQEKGLCEAVRSGAGIAGWHGGMGDAFRENVEYLFMIGGLFVCHPGGIIEYGVHIVRPEDPIMKGLKDFRVTSEQYYMHVDPSNDVLATTTFTGEHVPWIAGVAMPVVWKRTYGAGRVFYSSFGHVASEFDMPEVFEIMKRGMLWAAGV